LGKVCDGFIIFSGRITVVALFIELKLGRGLNTQDAEEKYFKKL